MTRRYRRAEFRERRKRQIMLRMGALILIVILMIAGVIKWNSYKMEKMAAEAEAEAAAQEAEMERERQERREKVLDLLAEEKYGPELTELYEKDTRVEDIMLNRADYPDQIIEYLVGHEEAIEWVAKYPEYMAKDINEINAKALEPIGEYDTSRNNIPLLLQWDVRWGYASYGEKQNIAMEGCGPTCLSMAVVGLTGDTYVTPKVVADMAVEQNHYVEDGGSSWTLFSMGPQAYGLTSTQIEKWSTTSITSELQKGNVVVCSVGPGDFTTIGHYILIVGLNEDGTVMINDPNSIVNSEMSWDVQRILNQTKGMWAIGR